MAKRAKVCLSCEKRRPRLIAAERVDPKDGKIYELVNAAKFPVFCSLRCAANWALLWVDAGDEHTESMIECGLVDEDGKPTQ